MFWKLLVPILLGHFIVLNAQYVPSFLKTKYGSAFGGNPNQGVKTYTKTKTKTKTSYGKPGNYGDAKYNGGCRTEPVTPYNSGITCSKFSGCVAKCISGYQFPNGDQSIYLSCTNGVWGVKYGVWESIPSCEPICMPQCQNNGICVAPDKCNCPENFSGPQCQYENKPCFNYPSMPRNSKRSCRSNICTISCMPGHEFPGGSSITTMECKNGRWEPTKQGWATVPDCSAKCDPPCQNGGNCLSLNVCQCPQNFRGPQCQYSSSACSARKLQFNGPYNCTGNLDSFSCSISCPEGIQFEFFPESLYTCTYDTGVFLPSPVPQCVYPKNVNVIPLEGASHSFYKTGFSMNSLTINGNKYKHDNDFWSTSKWNQMAAPTVDSHVEIIPLKQYRTLEHQVVIIEERTPKPGVCFTWGGSHFKTFDGRVFSVHSDCAHTLARDAVDNTFSVIVSNNPCKENHNDCYKIITIYLQDKEYTLKKSNKNVPILVGKKKTLPIPGQVPGLRAELSAHYVIVSLDSVGAKIKWDGHQMVQLEVNEALWNRTAGLCGHFDGDSSDDLTSKDGTQPNNLVTLAKSWQVDKLNDDCKSNPTEEHVCQGSGIFGSQSHRATEFCKKLLSDARFARCHAVLDTTVLLDACRWDYCSCESSDPEECACETVNVFVRACAYNGVNDLGIWRDEKTCPMKCTGGHVYMPCAPVGGQAVCGASVEKTEGCEEGCYCPIGTVMHDGKCITRDKCPCRLRGKDFPSGSSVPKDCNTCTCSEGQWICTQVACGARCSALGDPHYITFDGKRYDFMGQCSYYLMKTNDTEIEAENVACSGTISQAMNFPSSISTGLPSCTKTVTVKYGGQTIKLKQNHELTVNGLEITKLPYKVADITVRSVSSIFMIVELPNGVEVWWDGLTRAYVDVPSSFKGRTQGLCGTFNDNQKDDFVTPENDVEQSVIPFANKWKTHEKCNDIPDKLKSHPCEMNVHNKAAAEGYCKHLKSDVFAGCHWYVDPEPFYQDCLYDMCSCEGKASRCLCPMLAAYAEECAAKGVKLGWRSEVRECGVTCPAGQTYQVCGNPCTRTCNDVTDRPDCKQRCVEGCNCPEGQTLDNKGECVPIGRCGCRHDGLDFAAGYKEVRPASKGLELCTCINAQWTCKPAKPDEIKQFPRASDLKSKCNATRNFVFTTCESVEPTTCKNMHEEDFVSAGICHPGCECKQGYVLDTQSKICVRPSECPCHHGGRSYKENSVVQNDCNTCKCQNGKWDCTNRQCSAQCTAWGDSHFKTFDGKMFDYQGQCDYVLAKGVLEADNFDVTIQNVPCGTLGVSCSKSLTIKIGPESITLTRGKKVPFTQVFNRFTVRNRDLFVIVEAADLGLIVHWDKGTRVYVKVDPRWKNKVKGLCGNYNDNENDDFQTPSGGLTEVSARLFGDSWKLQSYCPEAHEITDTCIQRPDRKIWALKECGILKSSTFAPCHSEVPVDSYLDNCVFDSCACDQGGDCECLCTAIAAYAQECNNRGVPIKWRSQELCPIQCDERCSSYSPCVSTCPVETCDNLLVQSPLSKLCKEDSCVEGCEPKPCPAGFVYSNSSLNDCVPKSLCKPVCLEVDGIVYYEGDLMEEDACRSCYCSRGRKSCKGTTCAIEVTTPKTEGPITHQMEQLNQCKSGWTEWINQDKIQNVGAKTKSKMNNKFTDVEPLPDDIIMNNLKGPARCPQDKIANIECRTVRTHKHYKETGVDVECSLEKGLICQSRKGQRPCPDFEIRVLCKCEEEPVTTVVPCDVRKPNEEHPDDCHKFRQCSPITGLVEKTCGPNMLYNPDTMICDWPQNVLKIKPQCEEQITKETISEVGNEPEVVTAGIEEDILDKGEPACPDGYVMDSCAIECDRMCLHYSYIVKESGLCKGNTICESSCVSANKQRTCPTGMVWANNNTCVAIQNCMCTDHDGKPVKPGTVVKESDCMLCQCIDNYYTCDKSTCGDEEEAYTILPDVIETVSGQPKYVTEPTIMVVNTVTPPKECNPDMYTDLIQGDQPLPDDAFSASTVLGASFEAKHSRINSQITADNGGSWMPKDTNKDQYLQINFGKPEPVYGIVIKGSPLYAEFVTSFKVLYSNDGETYSFVTDKNKKPEVFRGSLDGNSPVKQMFNEPIEAKLIRVNPQTWHQNIALRVEFIGCGVTRTTTTSYGLVTPKFDQCFDPMGLGDGTMSDQQVVVSSEYGPNNSKKYLNIKGSNVWRPMTNSPTEWIEFNLMGPRNITGFVTKGGPAGWVTAFKVKYSSNGKDWNPILDELKTERTFLGNYDENSPLINNFDLPILATYVKIFPVKWQKNIALRIELHGCFEPYPIIEEPVATEAPSPCNSCPGTTESELELAACRCPPHLWFDGENCVSRPECPCVIGHIPYSIGTVFEKEDCSQCICKLGGVSHCTPKVCDKCDEGLKSIVTSTCGCVCLPCDPGTVLCPTSNICINQTSWCDGIQDCPDDEVNCKTTEVPTTTIEPLIGTTKVSESMTKACPKVECPPGYKVIQKKPARSQRLNSYYWTMFSTQAQKVPKKTNYLPKKTKGGTKGGIKDGSQVSQVPAKSDKTMLADKSVCPEYKCVSNRPPPEFIPGKPCPPARCPPGYNLEFNEEDVKDRSKLCPRYDCSPPPAPDAICNVTGRTFNTFDDTEYKYDICDHILVRDLDKMEWTIGLKKICNEKYCTKSLIVNHDDHVFKFNPDLSVEYDGFTYSVTQTKKIGSQSQSFTISRIGQTLLFVSNHYGFWVIWDTQSNVKVGVSSKLLGKVDGLCGFYNDNGADDKRKPAGEEARTTAEFGDSWGYDKEKCEPKTCPIHIQNKAWDMCNQVKSQVLSPCSKVIVVDTFISRCLESTCACLQNAVDNSTAEDQCRCKALETFVVDCMTADNDIELTDWRMLHECPVECEAPLVHHDCYRRRCEPTCETISDPNICPKLPNVCFPGCYCPPGLVRKGDSCIKASTCKDCECNVLPHLQYVTYDDTNFTVNGNCVYVMSRDVLEKYHDEHQFQVLVTNAPCRDNKDKTCVGKVTILYQGHKIHILFDGIKNNLKLIVDAERIDDFTVIADWANVRETKSKHLKILLTKAQVEVSIYFPSLGVSVKAPSHRYGGKLEGLCGDCNKDPENDMRTPEGLVTTDADVLGPSWFYDKLPGMTRETCSNLPKEECTEMDVNDDPCVQLVDIERYAQCHPVLDPGMFIEWCRKDTCGGHPELACQAIAAYGRECQSNGFCVKWRSDLCPAPKCTEDQEYKSCGGCLKTCESIKNKDKSKHCIQIPTDGCFCPEGKVMMNNTCVEEKMCVVCDDEGHHPGDVWQKDACTTCECVGSSMKCETKHCPAAETVCQRGLIPVKLNKNENECCDKYICVPAATAGPTCEPPHKLNCAPGQIMKLETKSDGCQQFVCVCKPIEDCDKYDMTYDPTLEPGMMKVLNDAGCCPVVNLVCKTEKCPKAPICEEFHKLKENVGNGKCCPEWICEPPQKCIVNLGYIAAEDGGERVRSKYEKQKVLKEVDETWQDGPCRDCKCYGSNSTGYQSVCSETECPAITSSSDYNDYELVANKIYGICCSEIKREACKHEGKVRKVGEKWTPEGDYCTKMECVKNDKYGIAISTQSISCDEKCELGSEYKPATPESKECCGSCKAVGCVVDGVVKQVGEEWSSADHCTNYFCINLNGTMQIQSVMVVCPDIPQEQLREYVYDFIPVEGECCKKHRMTACKAGYNVYSVGHTWPSPDGDKCKTISCVESKYGELLKQESVQKCNKDCAKGWEYVESKTECCGDCVQVACVIGDELKSPGENWTSADGCTTFSCDKYLDQFSVNSQHESCPKILDDCPKDHIIVKGCCKYCNITSEAQSQCMPEEIPATKSVGIVVAERAPHGICKNVEALKGFTECVGTCHSSTVFNTKSGSHESICSCCRATKYSPLLIELTCEDGYKFKKQVAVPTVCGCEGCSAKVINPFAGVKSR
ncbi:PREDICTED: hemocytin [Nicrophorus vespilloides]|uniref:Hemocytin n=1 Tax=Nicrophorus vespilloides TaxID=110193 RepID=A0ABM1N4N1_NICVS|nr:PREDICTED: hemocytin [Nicrophorus vespilloides]